MNDSDLRFDSGKKNAYRATSNLNTAMENPEVNINSAVGVNIQDVTNNNYGSLENNAVNYSFEQNNLNNSFEVNNQISDQNSNFQSSSFYKNDNFNGNVDVSNNFVNDVADEGNKSNTTNTNEFVNVNSPAQFVTTTNSNVNVDHSDVASMLKDKVIYEPTLKEKKKPKAKVEVSKEFKVMLFISFILFIFILVVPYIYDFFKELQLVITG